MREDFNGIPSLTMNKNLPSLRPGPIRRIAFFAGCTLLLNVAPRIAAVDTPQVVGEVSVDCRDYATHPSPRYRIAVKAYNDAAENPWPWIQLSIEERYFNLEDLTALACKLSKEFAHEHGLVVKVFDSYKAAKVWVPVGDTFEQKDGWRAPRAEYGFLRDTPGSHYLDWYLDPKKRQTVLRINFGPAP